MASGSSCRVSFSVLRRPEEPRHEVVEDRPQVFRAVLHRRAREAHAALGGELERGARGLRLGIADDVRLVEDHRAVLDRAEQLDVALEDVVAGQQQALLGQPLHRLDAVEAEVRVHRHFRAELLALVDPVVDHRARRDHQVDAGVLLVAVQDEGQRLHGLAQAHVVGEHAAQAAVGQEHHPVEAGVLVLAQRGVEALGQLDVRDRGAALGQAGEVEGGLVQGHGAAGLGEADGHGGGVARHAHLAVVLLEAAELGERAVAGQPLVVDARAQAVLEDHDVLAARGVLEQLLDRHVAAVDLGLDLELEVVVVGHDLGRGGDVGGRAAAVQAVLAADLPALQVGDDLGEEAVGGVAVGDEAEGAAALHQRAALDELVAALQFQVAVALALDDLPGLVLGDDEADALERVDLGEVVVVLELDVAAQARVDLVHLEDRLRAAAHLLGAVGLRRHLAGVRQHRAPRVLDQPLLGHVDRAVHERVEVLGRAGPLQRDDPAAEDEVRAGDRPDVGHGGAADFEVEADLLALVLHHQARAARAALDDAGVCLAIDDHDGRRVDAADLAERALDRVDLVQGLGADAGGALDDQGAGVLAAGQGAAEGQDDLGAGPDGDRISGWIGSVLGHGPFQMKRRVCASHLPSVCGIEWKTAGPGESLAADAYASGSRGSIRGAGQAWRGDDNDTFHSARREK